MSPRSLKKLAEDLMHYRDTQSEEHLKEIIKALLPEDVSVSKASDNTELVTGIKYAEDVSTIVVLLERHMKKKEQSAGKLQGHGNTQIERVADEHSEVEVHWEKADPKKRFEEGIAKIDKVEYLNLLEKDILKGHLDINLKSDYVRSLPEKYYRQLLFVAMKKIDIFEDISNGIE